MPSAHCIPRNSKTNWYILMCFTVISVLISLCIFTLDKSISPVELLKQDNVIVRDGDQLNKKLKMLIAGGAKKLQVITDFDSTLTKSEVNGQPTSHSLEIFASSKSLSQKYRDGCKDLEAKYGPQVSKDKTIEELQQIYHQWWDDHEKLTVGENVTLIGIQEAVDSSNTSLRDGCKEMLDLLSNHEIPATVVSAGLGEVVKYSLREFKPKIVSNFIRFDEAGEFLGFTKPTVSVYNKHKMHIPVEEGRENVILMGDSLGDSSMAENIPNIKTILKVGFFTGQDQVQLKRYCSTYDVVLLNDQTMNTVITILRLILT